jgi:hypothetical protein
LRVGLVLALLSVGVGALGSGRGLAQPLAPADLTGAAPAGGDARPALATAGDELWDGRFGALGTDGIVSAIAVVTATGEVYIGGNFGLAGGVPARNIARWDGAAWSAVGGGVDGWVYALALSGGDLYAGGAFTSAGGGGVPAGHVARWNGSSWSALAGGVDNTVYALAASGSDLYAGGFFLEASDAGGAKSVNYIARWNGSSWSALGGGMDMTVRALVLSGSNLYAGGYFVTAADAAGARKPMNYVARWDGASWSPLGGGTDRAVNALAMGAGGLYAGGAFTAATDGGGTKPAKRVARWDGASWSALAGGVDSTVFALATSGANVYAGGAFVNASDTVTRTANYVARWDGSGWSGLGSGTGANVFALAAPASGEVFAGGFFTAAGGKPSAHFGRYYVPAFTVGDVAVDEGYVGTTPAPFSVQLTAAPTLAVTVGYATADGTAKAGRDYVATSGVLTFPAYAAAAQSAVVPVIGDTVAEPDQTFFLDLSNPSAGTLLRARGVGTIRNDDAPGKVSQGVPSRVLLPLTIR